MRHSTKRKWKDALGFTGLVMAFSCALLFGPIWFAHLDCNTAIHHLEFIEACKADNDCTLTMAETQRYKAYLRMEIKSCPKE